MRTSSGRLTSAALVAAASFACSGSGSESRGPGLSETPGPSGPAGQSGRDGVDGRDGRDGYGGTATVALSKRAIRGFEITPVRLAIHTSTDTSTIGADTSEGAGTSTSAALLATEELERIGYGSYLVNAASDCAACHGMGMGMEATGYLSGGTPFSLGGDMVVYSRNLTPDAATGMMLTEEQFIRTMRTGEDPRNPGEILLVMPWPAYRWMSDHDLRAIYAYLRAIPAARNEVPDDMKGPAAMFEPVPFPETYDEGDVERRLPDPESPDEDFVRRGYAINPLEESEELRSADASTQKEFGRGSYLVNAVSACNECHGNPARDLTPGDNFLHVNTANYLTGGEVFDTPPPLQATFRQVRSMSANLTGAENGFDGTLLDFLTIIEEGVAPEAGSDGELALDPVAWPMPWPMFRHMILEDLVSIYTFVTLTPRRTGDADKRTQEEARYCTTDTDCDGDGGETCVTASSECVGGACGDAGDCGACQTCEGGLCAVTSTTSSCFVEGL